ncbi:TonB-dependent receptor domain-containing protein [Novosphingobium colocasiae]|uniref:TonB-dependent receptor domain-containing protein n=1 Tax=Novosphingobium colocasiae TaxID=1256513 RepID=UPI0035B353A5
MTTPRFASLLLLSTALVAVPALAHAQDAQDAQPVSTQPDPAAETPVEPEQAAPEEQAPEVSIPGGAIIVTGRRNANIQRVSPQVVTVLGTEEIARTGEGDIAGALGRVTGLSVVGNGYVYVRGLGDRYSLALLNGSPLPSPEPLKRVVPLDLFPTSIIASSLVQKSYSANFPGEFGGGVINLTTKAVPKESYLSIGGGVSGNTETTNKLGYTYYGAGSDWTGFDDGTRDMPKALTDFIASGATTSGSSNAALAAGGALITGNNALVQRWKHLPANFSGSIDGGTAIDVGSDRLGILFSAGYSNKWTSRDVINQRTGGLDANQLDSDFRSVNTDNQIVVNGLLGLGYEFGDNTIRWTNVYIRDTVKHTKLGLGYKNNNNVAQYLDQSTAWYERQLIDTQLVAELKPLDDTTLDLRAGYANSQREAPFEIDIESVKSNTGPLGGYFINALNGGNGGDATIAFSDLNEDLWSAGFDVSHRFSNSTSFTFGYAFQHSKRTSARRFFRYRASGSSTFVNAFGLWRPDLLLSHNVLVDLPASGSGIDYAVSFAEEDGAGAIFNASFLNHGVYGKIDSDLTEAIKLDLGVRWESGKMQTSVVPVPGFSSNPTPTEIDKAYVLPSATVTWELEPSMQLRASASQTLARPQFRELQYQLFFDPDSNRTYRGNPYLKDSKITNAEARFEWYMSAKNKISVGGFWKKLKNPIETYMDTDFVINYANAPEATLYGAELELQKYFDAFGTRQFLVSANYTWSKSRLKVSDGDTVKIASDPNVAYDASIYFRNGAPLTGQSEHIANAQIGLEDTDSLSQQTFLINFASKRSISRGVYDNGQGTQGDVIENPGFTIDFVARQGLKLAGLPVELKFEARNLTNRKHFEYQDLPNGRIQTNTYRVGRAFALSASVDF